MLVGRDRAQMRTSFVVGARPAGWFVSCVVTLCCQFSVAIGVDKKIDPRARVGLVRLFLNGCA